MSFKRGCCHAIVFNKTEFVEAYIHAVMDSVAQKLVNKFGPACTYCEKKTDKIAMYRPSDIYQTRWLKSYDYIIALFYLCCDKCHEHKENETTALIVENYNETTKGQRV